MALPELTPCEGGRAEFSVKTAGYRDFDREGFSPSFEWHDALQRQVCRTERRGAELLFSFPHHAAFHLPVDGVITCLKEPGASVEMMRHLLINQVIPRYLAHRGELVLHASALVLEKGVTIAFLGRSGHGKSTLASAFHQQGATLLSDDSILVDLEEGSALARGGLHGVRLLPDVKRALFRDAGKFERYSPYTEKQQMLFRSEPAHHLDQSGKLDLVYVLNDPGKEMSNEVRFEPVSLGDAVVSLMHCAFSFDPGDTASRTSGFEQAANLLDTGIELFKLSYPRDLSALPALVRAIGDHARDQLEIN